jgi:hypothetical protein
MGSGPRKRDQFIARFAMTGFGLAVLVFALAYLENLARGILVDATDGLIQLVFLILCPPSFALMGTENATGFGLALVLFEIAILNSTLYAVLGAIIFRLWVRQNSANQ